MKVLKVGIFYIDACERAKGSLTSHTPLPNSQAASISKVLMYCYREFVDMSLMVTYYFGVTVYIVFIASSVKQVHIS